MLPGYYAKRATDDVVYPHFELFPGHICTAREATMPDTVDSPAKLSTSTSILPANSTKNAGYSTYNGLLTVVQYPVKVGSVYLENGYPTLSICELAHLPLHSCLN